MHEAIASIPRQGDPVRDGVGDLGGAKRCTKCGEFWDLTCFPREPRNTDGRHSHCKECHKRRLRQWRERNPDRVASALRRQQEREADRLREACREYHARNPEKIAAHKAVRLALKKGTLEKPSYCQDCGAANTDLEIQGHHFDYSKPLEVEWLCRSCHGKRHRVPNRVAGSTRRKQDRA